ncbi:MAG TPA: hypothetical protein VF818_12850 [Ktedonobacterales bacterium]
MPVRGSRVWTHAESWRLRRVLLTLAALSWLVLALALLPHPLSTRAAALGPAHFERARISGTASSSNLAAPKTAASPPSATPIPTAAATNTPTGTTAAPTATATTSPVGTTTVTTTATAGTATATATATAPVTSGGGGNNGGGGSDGGGVPGPQPTRVILSQPTIGVSASGGVADFSPSGMNSYVLLMLSTLGCVFGIGGLIAAVVTWYMLVNQGWGPMIKAVLLGNRRGQRRFAGASGNAYAERSAPVPAYRDRGGWR